MSPVIDVHTHMVSEAWLKLLRDHGGTKYQFRETADLPLILCDGAPFFTLNRNMFDYEARIRNMDAAGVDVSVVSLTAPSCFFGGPEVSLLAARTMNDELAAARRAYPDRIRFFATIPWQYPDLAVAELKRAHASGASGVMVIANIDGASLTDPLFAPVWRAIDDLALPVLVHPTAPPGVAMMDMATYNLAPPLGFCFDTSLAIARCIYDGFFDRYQKLHMIAAHGGGALPYLVGRLDICHERIPACAARIEQPPSAYMRRILVDAVVFRQDALEMCVSVCGAENVLYGSDYPHNIGDMQSCLARVDALPEPARQLVRGRNAQRIFGF
ncbi:Amidohydrolase [Pigmentiphaga humi]|uniref:Amidohydrolase n=1 Tax=Pigmentiphaga humi TaxID=2478468 RepID=A0A3P4B2K8_9BURK|nr:amidohydrolase family protein [Pigmentiphaga humi]VCU70513.1 Amidohydrolase [Pigmentiphaga humi]